MGWNGLSFTYHGMKGRDSVMATVVSSIGMQGIDGYRVQVEVQLIPGKEEVNIVGLPDASVKESKDRVHGSTLCEWVSNPR